MQVRCYGKSMVAWAVTALLASQTGCIRQVISDRVAERLGQGASANTDSDPGGSSDAGGDRDIGVGGATTTAAQPLQPATGPGSSEARHAGFTADSYLSGAQQYFLYQPAEPRPVSAPVVVLLHGYTGINPRIYGGWIDHLLKRGYIVIYPVYQETLRGAADYTDNALAAIRDAFGRLGAGGNVTADPNGFALVGHSLGCVIAFNVAAQARAVGLPAPRVLLAANPGDSDEASSAIASIQAASYDAIPSDLLVLLIVGEEDRVVGDRTARSLYAKIGQIPASRRTLLELHSDDYGLPPLAADHSAATCLDARFDSGRSLSRSGGGAVGNAQRFVTDSLDYYGYWKFLDALLDATFRGASLEAAIGGSEAQTSMGQWSDGTPVTPAEVLLP